IGALLLAAIVGNLFNHFYKNHKNNGVYIFVGALVVLVGALIGLVEALIGFVGSLIDLAGTFVGFAGILMDLVGALLDLAGTLVDLVGVLSVTRLEPYILKKNVVICFLTFSLEKQKKKL
ncbi:hypothetical protein RFI_36053, partial [Reticulomyxa filosa]